MVGVVEAEVQGEEMDEEVEVEFMMVLWVMEKLDEEKFAFNCVCIRLLLSNCILRFECEVLLDLRVSASEEEFE